MKVNFYLEKKHKKENLILMYISSKGKRVSFSTQWSIELKYWSEKRQRAKNNYKYAIELNSKLSGLESLAQDLNLKDRIIDPEQIRDKILFNRDGSQTSDTFLKQYQSYIETKEELGLSTSHKKSLYTSLNNLTDYIKIQRAKNTLEAIDLNWMESYHRYLIAKKLNNNYIRNLLKKLIQYMKMTLENGLHKNAEILKYKLPPEKESITVSLSLDELKAIEDLSGLELYHENARKVFLIGCYTGLRYSDLSKITDADLDGDELRLYQTKTKSVVTVPLHSKVKPLINELINGEVRVISSQKLNTYIKQVCFLADITKPVKRVTYSGVKTIEEVMPKYQLVSSHTMRRTFATLMDTLNVPHKDIMKVTGHKNIADFQKYIRSDDEQAKKNIKDAFDRL